MFVSPMAVDLANQFDQQAVDGQGKTGLLLGRHLDERRHRYQVLPRGSLAVLHISVSSSSNFFRETWR
jgi:hypothetical protein